MRANIARGDKSASIYLPVGRDILDGSVIPTVVTKFYCPLTVTLYARNRWDNIDGDGYEEDGRFAARYADRIREEMREVNAEDGENMA